MVLVDRGILSEHAQVIRFDIGPDRLRNVEMSKMSQFEPISGKKLKVLS
jgi:hypothetical protein